MGQSVSHCLIARFKEVRSGHEQSMPEMIFCFAHSANHHTADFFWQDRDVAFGAVERKLPKVEGMEINEIDE